jgi:hypothetical protein
MRVLGIGLLVFSLVFCGISAAQMHGMGITPSDGIGGTAAGASRTALGPGIRISPPNFPHHHHHQFQRNAWGYWPYYGGYMPYDYGYDLSGYTGYTPGTFQSYPYPPYPYGGSPYAPPYAPYADYAPAPPEPPPIVSYVPPADQSAPDQHAYSRPTRSASARAKEETPAQPTVLVFRDGHKEEVDSYAIMGSTLFVVSGRRARIPIAELNIPETIRQNESRGLEFQVPGKAQ